jgi:hypothetical protein
MWRHIKTTIRELMDAAYASKQVFEDLKEPPSELSKYIMREPDYWTTAHYLELCDRADWTGAPPELRRVVARAIERMRKAGFPCYVHTVWRSPQVQLQKFKQGRSKLRSGAHNRSAAADVVHAHHHWDCAKPYWDFWGLCLQEAAQSEGVKINWGGDWSFYDPAHVELADWKERPIVPEHDRPERNTPRSILRRHGIPKATNKEVNKLMGIYNAHY